MTAVLTAMGAMPRVESSESGDTLRIDVEGEGAEALLFQRGDGAARAADAGEHRVPAAAWRRPQGARRLPGLPPRQGRRAAADGAASLVEKALQSGAAQEMGPLNSYERRIVHMAVAEIEGVSSESIGDAAVKTVIISRRGK